MHLFRFLLWGKGVGKAKAVRCQTKVHNLT